MQIYVYVWTTILAYLVALSELKSDEIRATLTFLGVPHPAHSPSYVAQVLSMVTEAVQRAAECGDPKPTLVRSKQEFITTLLVGWLYSAMQRFGNPDWPLPRTGERLLTCNTG